MRVRYRGGNSTTAEEVSRFQCLFPNPNWLMWKGIPPPKTHSNSYGWITGWWRIFHYSGRVKSCKVLPKVWLSTLGQTSDPSIAWKKKSDVFKIKDDDDDEDKDDESVSQFISNSKLEEWKHHQCEIKFPRHSATTPKWWDSNSCYWAASSETLKQIQKVVKDFVELLHTFSNSSKWNRKTWIAWIIWNKLRHTFFNK